MDNSSPASRPAFASESRLERLQDIHLKTLVWHQPPADSQPISSVEPLPSLTPSTVEGQAAARTIMAAIGLASVGETSPLAMGVQGFLLGLKLSLVDPSLAADAYAALHLSEDERRELRGIVRSVCHQARSRNN